MSYKPDECRAFTEYQSYRVERIFLDALRSSSSSGGGGGCGGGIVVVVVIVHEMMTIHT